MKKCGRNFNTNAQLHLSLHKLGAALVEYLFQENEFSTVLRTYWTVGWCEKHSVEDDDSVRYTNVKRGVRGSRRLNMPLLSFTINKIRLRETFPNHNWWIKITTDRRKVISSCPQSYSHFIYESNADCIPLNTIEHISLLSREHEIRTVERWRRMWVLHQ